MKHCLRPRWSSCLSLQVMMRAKRRHRLPPEPSFPRNRYLLGLRMEESRPKHEWSRNQFCMDERVLQDPNRCRNWHMNLLGNRNWSWRGKSFQGPRTVCLTGKVSIKGGHVGLARLTCRCRSSRAVEACRPLFACRTFPRVRNFFNGSLTHSLRLYSS